ncbi:MAG: UDP-N-acetylglucosamine 2-epimerase (non-hydrolyzing), partial [Bdellovibrionia bacterium]
MSTKKLKVLTVVGTRPEIIRLSRVLTALDRDTEHVLVHTGQNYDYELNEIFFKDLELRKPDYFLEAAEATPALTMGKILTTIDPILEKVKPDAFLVLGDTNSCLSALAAKKRKIPVFHMEAGNRCFDQRVPEETNRKMVDHISDINMTYSTIARDYLIRENFPADRVIKTGSPMFEVLKYYEKKIDASKILEELKLDRHSYFVVSSHREENVDQLDRLKELVRSINSLVKTHGKKAMFPVHPRTKARLAELGESFDDKVILTKPFGFLDYVKLQKNAAIVLSDSGTITEESSILNFPAMNIRESHERPE